MITISLCMIVKNEEDVLGRCLESVKDIVDEIIIVDTGSLDTTKEIASKYTEKLYEFPWIDDFSAARNYSFSKATMEYIMWLDADDELLQEDRIKLQGLKESLDTLNDMVMMKYNVGFDEQGNVNFSYFRERLFKRSMNFMWIGVIHEVIPPRGKIFYSNVCVSHKKIHPTEQGRNLRIFEKMIAEGKELDPRNLFYYARELYYNQRYEDSIKSFNEFLDSGEGWIEDCLTACRDLSRCYSSINDNKNRLKALFRSFEYDLPRAEICCEIGKFYLDNNEYERAIFWYELIINTQLKNDTIGFVLNDCYGYIPNIQLCVCYYKIGNREKAIEYNEKAAKFKPDDPSVSYNRSFFNSLERP